MARRGRPSLLIPTVEWKLKIPAPVAVRLDMLVLDPLKGVPAYGQRSALVTQILRDYLAKLDKPLDGLENGEHNVPLTLPENTP